METTIMGLYRDYRVYIYIYIGVIFGIMEEKWKLLHLI